MLTEAKKKFIEFMMSADVLRFGDFTTKSGRKTPYFVNTGNYKTGAQISTAIRNEYQLGQREISVPVSSG